MRAINIKTILNEVRMSVGSTHSRKSTDPSHKSTKLTTIHKVTPNRPNDLFPRRQQGPFHFRTISSSTRPDPSLSNAVRASAVTKVGTTPQSTLSKGMNDKFLFLRKENHLNTQFNLRKNKLKEITKANKQIYKRLNTQKSFYSNSQLSKSYESTQEIKERLSQSKLSNRLSSARSSKKSLKDGVVVKKPIKMQIKAKNINGIGQQEINKFKGLFIRDFNSQKHQNYEEKETLKFNSYRKNEYVIKNKASARMSTQARPPNNDGSILHRVAELLQESIKEGKENRQRRGSLIIPKSRKMFNF